MQTARTARGGGACRLLWLAIMLVTTPVHALGPVQGDDNQPPGEPPAALQPQVPDTDTAADGANTSRRVQTPAVPRSSADSFTPTERIKADSAVAFPVDI